ncbi:hypothetical protein [Calothrix sp. 336/3]|nr:hypothetical protein [Calothrix sp. 336/3]
MTVLEKIILAITLTFAISISAGLSGSQTRHKQNKALTQPVLLFQQQME